MRRLNVSNRQEKKKKQLQNQQTKSLVHLNKFTGVNTDAMPQVK